ncbi:MAG TPA: hypothetical protein ENK89_03990 [Desulfobulbaceae bacterium]|nr:hypothetical protein [Desulfobulbaceae bacterium]
MGGFSGYAEIFLILSLQRERAWALIQLFQPTKCAVEADPGFAAITLSMGGGVGMHLVTQVSYLLFFV